MWTWWTKTFESDGSLDFVSSIYDWHKEGKEKDDFLFKDLKRYLKEISTSEYLEIGDSEWVEVSSYIFSELINYDEKRIKKSLKDLEEELQDECEWWYKLDLTKDIYKIIEEVEEKDWFIPNEMYIDLCLYKNKNYNIWETFLYRLLRQLNNLLFWNSENYENCDWDEDWLEHLNNIFVLLIKWLKEEKNIKNALKMQKMKQSFSRDWLKWFKKNNSKWELVKIVLKWENIKMEENYKNNQLVKIKEFEKIHWYFRILKIKNFKNNVLENEEIIDYKSLKMSYSARARLEHKKPEIILTEEERLKIKDEAEKKFQERQKLNIEKNNNIWFFQKIINKFKT